MATRNAAVVAKIDSRLSALRAAAAEFGIVSFNPSPVWAVSREIGEFSIEADEFCELVQRGGGSWIVLHDGDDSFSATVDANSMPDGVAIEAVVDWKVAVVVASRDVAEYKIVKGTARFRAYPILD